MGQKNWRGTKKVGSLIRDKEVIERRKQLCTAALIKLKNIWIGGDKKKKERHKSKTLQDIGKSILTYNCGTMALTQTKEAKVDAFH